MIEDIRNPSEEISGLIKRTEYLEKNVKSMADKLNEAIDAINELIDAVTKLEMEKQNDMPIQKANRNS